MSAPAPFPDWSWGNPDECTHRLDAVRAGSATCTTLRALGLKPPYGRAELRDLGITGVEFAAFRSRHHAALAVDQLKVRSPAAETEPGRIFLLDGRDYFAELDITDPLPFTDGSLDWVYAEHLVEHVPPDAAIRWLREIRRVLGPAGLLRLTTPDLDRYVRAYLDGAQFFREHRRRMRTVLAPAPEMPDRPAFMLNQIFAFFGHRWIYDEAELRYGLTAAGFDPAAIRIQGYRRGRRPDVAALDRPERNDETMYVEVG